jgi:hypothetical protein
LTNSLKVEKQRREYNKHKKYSSFFSLLIFFGFGWKKSIPNLVWRIAIRIGKAQLGMGYATHTCHHKCGPAG